MKLFDVITRHLYKTVQEPGVTSKELVEVISFWFENPQLDIIEDYQRVMVLLVELLEIIAKHCEAVSIQEDLLSLLIEINDNVTQNQGL